MAELLHIDGSGRGLEDGECSECGMAGNLVGWECPARLRAQLDRHEQAAGRLLELRASLDPIDLQVARRAVPAVGSLIYNLGEELTHLGWDVPAALAKRWAR